MDVSVLDYLLATMMMTIVLMSFVAIFLTLATAWAWWLAGNSLWQIMKRARTMKYEEFADVWENAGEVIWQKLHK